MKNMHFNINYIVTVPQFCTCKNQLIGDFLNMLNFHYCVRLCLWPFGSLYSVRFSVRALVYSQVPSYSMYMYINLYPGFPLPTILCLRRSKSCLGPSVKKYSQ